MIVSELLLKKWSYNYKVLQMGKKNVLLPSAEQLQLKSN
jgi:hypothetical protein